MAVWVDSNHVGNVSSGKSLQLTVTAGVHRVECGLQAAHMKDGAQEFNVPLGKRLIVVVAPSRWDGRPEFTAEIG